MPKYRLPFKLFYLALIIIVFVFAQIIPLACTSKNNKSDKNGKPKREAQKTVKTAGTVVEFEVQNSEVIVQEKIAQSRAQEIEALKTRETDEITGQIKRYYEAAFLQPELWQNGSFSGLESSFVPTLKDRVTQEDLGKLALGDEAGKIESVRGVDARITDLWIAVDSNLAPRLCQAKVDVEATYIQKDKQRADFESSATLLLEPVSDTEWQIFNYDVRYEVKTEKN